MMEDGLKYHQINTNFDLCILSPYIFLSDIAVGYLTSTATKWLVNAGDASSLTAETDGPYAWDYCFKEEKDADPEEMYYGRGPIQLTGKSNYEAAGKALGYDLINNPGIVASNPTISFKTAVWFWMTTQSPKPSPHTVMIGKWSPSGSDTAAGRVPGYGVVTNIINGGVECGRGSDSNQEDRIGFYKAYCDILGASYGSNVDCNTQRSFGG